VPQLQLSVVRQPVVDLTGGRRGAHRGLLVQVGEYLKDSDLALMSSAAPSQPCLT
jgi:hypothetical protein